MSATFQIVRKHKCNLGNFSELAGKGNICRSQKAKHMERFGSQSSRTMDGSKTDAKCPAPSPPLLSSSLENVAADKVESEEGNFGQQEQELFFLHARFLGTEIAREKEDLKSQHCSLEWVDTIRRPAGCKFSRGLFRLLLPSIPFAHAVSTSLAVCPRYILSRLTDLSPRRRASFQKYPKGVPAKRAKSRVIPPLLRSLGLVQKSFRDSTVYIQATYCQCRDWGLHSFALSTRTRETKAQSEWGREREKTLGSEITLQEHGKHHG